VRCWGRGEDGQLGDGLARSSSAAGAPVMGLPAVVGLAAGGGHTCARTGAGQLFCWGRGDRGQLGTGMTANAAIAVALGAPAPTDATAIAAGAAHTCAVGRDGSVTCWGASDAGQVGRSAEAVANPVRVDGLSDVVAVSAGGAHTCAVERGGAVRCWGLGANGQLGEDTPLLSPRPRFVALPCL
jgi:alpha-tubulin suppressor-like RCC1 family protein